MGRYYVFSKKITEEESKEIIKEMDMLDDVKQIEIGKSCDKMKVITKDNEFSDVMGCAVNICSKVARGVELSFSGFAM